MRGDFVDTNLYVIRFIYVISSSILDRLDLLTTECI